MVATDNEVSWDDEGIAEQRGIHVIGAESFCIEQEEGYPPSSAHEVAAAGNFVCCGRA